MRRSAFTLIELLIVIAIIAILAGAMVPLINFSRLEARIARAGADIDAIKTAAVMLHYDTSQWPPASTVGDDLITDVSGFDDWNGPYLDDWRNDPWGSPYQIYDSVAQRRVRSYGPDSEQGTVDDIDLLITPSY